MQTAGDWRNGKRDIGTLRTVLQHRIHQHQRQHRFGNRYSPNTDTGIMTPLRFHHDRIAATIDGMTRKTDRGRRFDGNTDPDILPCRNTAQHTAGMIA